MGTVQLESNDLAPSASDRWRHLETLNLSGNRFDCIPAVLCHLHNVRPVARVRRPRDPRSARSSQCEPSPAVSAAAHQLRRLYLSHNRLRTAGIPAAILRLSSLRTLTLAHNLLVRCPRWRIVGMTCPNGDLTAPRLAHRGRGAAGRGRNECRTLFRGRCACCRSRC